MSDLVVGLGLVLVIEGLVWAISPNWALGMLQKAAAMPEQTIRTAAALAVALGVGVVWAVRG